jgi:hypothetical protein
MHLPMQEKLTGAIDKEMNSTTKNVTSIVKTEFAIFEVEDKRGLE